MAAPFPSPTTKWHTTSYQSISPTRPELSAKGKNVLITGGGSGIGAETARAFAAAGAARIALLGRREQALLDTKASIERDFGSSGVDVFVAPTDITKKDEVDAAFARFVGAGGQSQQQQQQQQIDILVSNAALTGPHEPARSADAAAFLEAIHLNLAGALHVAQAFARHAARERAVVVEVNSNAAHINYTDYFASYSIAKLAVFRLWDSLAVGMPDVSIFHIQPGVVRTAMNDEVGGVDAVGFEDHVSLPANFILWLASPEARFLKNKYLWANWDVDELKARANELENSRELNIDLVGWPFGKPDWKPTWNN